MTGIAAQPAAAAPVQAPSSESPEATQSPAAAKTAAAKTAAPKKSAARAASGDVSILAASDPPGVPTAAVLTPGNLSVTATWGAPAADPSAGTVNHYLAQLVGTVRTCRVEAANTRSCTFTGLTAGTSYTVTVTAYSSTDESTASTGVTTSAAIPGPPSAPAGTPSVVAGNQQVAVTWLASPGGGATATYTASAYLASDSTTAAGTPCTVASPTLTCNVTGLTGGVGYKFKVIATGPGVTGVSPASTISATAIPGPPSVPASITAVPTADATVTLTWPASTGGVANYTVTTTNAGTSAAVPGATCDSAGVATTCTISSGLTDGTTYKFQVRSNGTGALGNSAYSGFSNTVTVGAPSTPGTPVAALGNLQSRITYAAPSYDGSGAGIDHYIVTAYTGGASVTTCTDAIGVGSDNECTVTGLTSGTAYTFKVVAYGTSTSAFPSPPSAESNEIIPGPPSKPGTPTVVAGNATAVISWTQPSTGRAVQRWVVTTKNADTDAGVGGATCTVTVTGGDPLPAKTCTISAGLVAGTPYKFIVTAYGDSGDLTGSTASDASATTTVGPPTTPTAPTVVAGNGTATLTWTQPAGGVAISGYAVATYDVNNGDALVAGKSCTTTGALTCPVTTLAGGSYKFKVTATAANSLGTAVSAFSAATPVGPPVKPVITNVVATTATSATVTFTPGDANGGGGGFGSSVPVHHYVITASPSTGTTPCADVTESGGSPYSCLVTGLTSGTTYSFTVTAVATDSTLGTAASDPAPGFTPGTLAAATVTTLVAGKQQVAVTWTPAIGMVVEDYTATATPVAGGGGITTGCLDVVGSATTCTITGLATGTAYTVTVLADELGGANRQLTSSASAQVITGAPPAAASVFGTAGDGFIFATWTAPTAPDATGTGTNGNAFLKYRLVADADGVDNDEFCESSVRTTRFCTITGVTNQIQYTLKLRTYGPGDANNYSEITGSTVTPVGAPTAPRNVTAVSGNAYIDVNWLAPIDDGDGIVSYTVVGTGGNICVVPAGTLTCRLSGLTNLTEYSIYVIANGEGIAGNSPHSTAVTATPSAAASMPVSVTATPGDGTITVNWAAGAGGGVVTGFTVTATSSGQSDKTCPSVGSSATTCTITGVTGGREWMITVVANSVGGNSAPASPSPATVTPGPPNAPVITATEETGEGEITVQWNAPAAGGVAVASYTVTTVPTSGAHVCTDLIAPMECVLTGLEPGGTYTVVVTATAAGGLGTSSDTSDSVELDELNAPGITSVTGGVGTITVNWTAPSTGLDLDSYAVTTTPTTGAHTCTDTTSPYSCTLTGIAAGSYTVTVTIMTEDGSSNAATSGSAVVTEDPSAVDPPVIASVVQGVGLATVTWTAPSGVTVDHYSVSVSPNEGTSSGLPTVCDDVPGAADSLSCTITDLSPGTAYTFTVTLHTEATGGLTSEAVTDAVTVGPPGTPTAVTAQVLGPRSIIVAWTAPTNAGGIASYQVEATPGGILCNQPNPAFRSCRFDNLVNGNRYTFKVTSVGESEMGASAASDASLVYTLNPALPATVPASNGLLGSSRGNRLNLGQITTLTGQFYRPNTPLTIGIYPGPTVRGFISANGSGAFSTALAIPTTIGTGARTIVIAGMSNLGVMRYMTLPITVTRPAASAGGGAVLPGGASTPSTGTDGSTSGSGMTVGGSAALPTTGNSIATVILTGFGILLAGLSAIAVTYGAMVWRRRKVTRTLTPAS